MKTIKKESAIFLALLSTTSCADMVDDNHERRPNILIAIADDMSYPHAGAYGCGWVNTPGFDRVAEEGILMENFYTPNSKSAPSRACLLTGQYSWQLEEIGNHLACWPEDEYTTIFEALSQKGYRAGFTGKGWAPGDPGKVNGKPRRLTGKPYQKHKLTPPTSCIAAVDYASNFDAFLDDGQEDEPWIFWYGSREPHRAYEYGTGVSQGGLDPDKIDDLPSYWPDNEIVRNDMLDYSFEISWFDSHLLQMIESLEERGELDNTIIIVTADNGMPFPRRKGFGYEHSTHLPMAMMWPEGIVNAGRRDSSLVSMVDISPTLLELVGFTPEEVGMSPEGVSIMDILTDSKRKKRPYMLFGQERHDCGRPGNQGYPIRSIRKGDYLYMHNFKPWLWPACDPETGYLNTDGSPTKTQILQMRREGIDTLLWHQSFGKNPQEQLYDLSKDPECLNNLAYLPDFDRVKKRLQRTLFKELRRQGDPRLGENGDIFDSYAFSQERYESYYERYMSGKVTQWQTDWVNRSDYECCHQEPQNEVSCID